MAGIIGALGTLTEIFSQTDEGLSGKSLLKALRSKEVALLRADGSMLKLIGNYIVEPVIVVSNELRNDDVIDNVLGIHTDIFTGFYMQVFDIIRAHFGIKDNNAIDLLATDNGGLERLILAGADLAVADRDHVGDLFKGKMSISISTESGLSFNEQAALEKLKNTNQKTLEEDKHNNQLKRDELNRQAKLDELAKKEAIRLGQYKDKNQVASSVSASVKDLNIPNAIQRTIQVTITRPMETKDGQPTGAALTVVIPINIKAHVIFTDISNIINVMQPNSDDKGMFNRIDEYRAGAISLTDLLFAGDIINEYKQNKLKDKDQLLQIIQNRVLSANSKVINGGVGFEKYYNMYIISAQDLIRVEKHLNGKVAEAKFRQKFLEQAYGLSLTVMDQDHEIIKLMLKDLGGVSTLTYKAAVKSDKKGNDMGEIVKSLINNKPMVF